MKRASGVIQDDLQFGEYIEANQARMGCIVVQEQKCYREVSVAAHRHLIPLSLTLKKLK